MERALAAIVDADAEVSKTPPPMSAAVHVQGETVQFQPKRPQTLADQVQQMERIGREISSRLRREMVEANSHADRLVAEANAHYARQLSEETARLQRERDEAIRQAVEDYYTRRNELEGLLRRRT
jgi:F0F1-type ATP synthase membrane subunit b/b'